MFWCKTSFPTRPKNWLWIPLQQAITSTFFRKEVLYLAHSLVAAGVGLRDKHRSGRDWICLETHRIQRIWSEWMEYDEHVGNDLKQRIEADFSSSEPSVAADRLSRRWLLSGPATNMHNRQNSFKHLHWPLPALYIFVQVHAILLTASNLKSNMFKTHEELRYFRIFFPLQATGVTI